mgnify:CR=1 FL=1
MKKTSFVAIMLLAAPYSAHAERMACITPTLLQEYTEYAENDLEDKMLTLRQKDACFRLYDEDILQENTDDGVSEITHSSGFTVYAMPTEDCGCKG